MAYATINKPNQYFNTVLWTGTNSSASRTVTGVGFQPDLVWGKSRDTAVGNYIYDAVRGAGAEKELFSASTVAEGGGNCESYDYLSSFNSDGFASTYVSNGAEYFNYLNRPYVAWNWKANGAGVSNNSGSITSTVSANTTSGFSIVSYTNPSSGNPFTVGHGLGVAPKMIIVKTRNVAQTWGVWHTSIGFGNYLRLDSTAGTAAANLVTATSSTTFSTYQNHHATNDTLIAYCFAEVKGYSKFGSYTGNGSTDGTFVYTGFKPAWVLIKLTTTIGEGVKSWILFDNKRNIANPENKILYPNTSGAEDTADFLDFTSNGFKLRTTDGSVNASGATYIYAAFAENPLVGTNNVPATAR